MTHPARKGSTESRAGLVRAASPQSRPKTAQFRNLFSFSRFSVIRKSTQRSNVASQVSQMRSTGKYMAYGQNAHAQPDHFATRSPKLKRAIRKARMQTSADISAFSESKTIAEAFV